MNSSLSLRLYHALDGAWRRRYLIVLPILLLPFLGLTVGLVTPKKYAAHTSMLIQETAKMNPFLEDLAVSAMIKERVAALDTLLHSRFILKGVAQTRELITSDTPPIEQDRIISYLSSSLSMSMPGKDMIRIDYRASRPEGMKEMLEAVTTHFVEQLLAPERSSLTDSATFLKENLELRRKELEESEAALADFRSQHANTLPELHSNSASRLAHLQQRLIEREALLAGAQRNLGGLDQQLSKTNPVLGRIEEQIVLIRGEMTLLMANYTERHSKVQAAVRKLRRLESERINLLKDSGKNAINPDQLWSIASTARLSEDQGGQPLLISQLENLQNVRGEVNALTEEVLSLRRSINQLQQQASSLGQQEQQLSKLQRDLKVKRELYENLLERYEMARLTGSLGLFEQEKRIKLIDRPFTPSRPTNLPLMLYIIGGLLGGIFLGLGLALVAELIDSTVRRREQLIKLTGVPVITRLPPIPSLPDALT